MKKYISVFIITALLVTMFTGFGGTAQAAGDIEFTVTPRVTEMTSGGSVTFDFYIVNRSSASLEGYQIKYDGKKIYSSDVPVLNDQAAVYDSFSMEVKDDMLGTSLVFQLCDRDGNGITFANPVIIARKGQTPAIACTAYADQTLVAVGDIVTFTFKVENKGDVRLDNIEVKASKLKNSQPLNTPAFSLDIGQSATITYRHTFTAAITVEPYITYTVNGVNQTPYRDIAPIALTESTPNVEVSLDADDKTPDPGQEVTFTLKIANNGNMAYTKLSVTWNGTPMSFPTTKLNPGDSYDKQYKMTFDTSTDVKFTITLKNQNGVTKSVSTNTINILLPVDPTALQSGLKLIIEADRDELTSAGIINFSGYISNDSEYTLSEVSITEPSLGEIFSMSEMAGATKQPISLTADINETTTYNFTLSVKDRNGQVYTVNAEPITVTIQNSDPTTVDPSVSAATVTLPPKGTVSDPVRIWSTIAIVLVVLIIAVGAALIILWRNGRSPSRSASRTMATKAKKPIRGGYSKPVRSRSFRDRNNF